MRDEQGAQCQRPPISRLQRHLGEGYQSVDIDQADDAALRTIESFRARPTSLPELCAVVKGFHELKNIFDAGSFPQESDSLLIKGLRLFEDILFFRKEKQITVLGDSSALSLILF